MKKMTCRELGGACDRIFMGSTFEEIEQQSKAHAKEMMQIRDADHLQAMKAMMELMQDPQAMKSWMDDRRRAFQNAPEV